MAALEKGVRQGAAAAQTANNIEKMADEIRALAKPGSGMKVETTHGQAECPSMARNASVEKPVNLPPIDFGKTATDLTVEQRQAIRHALEGINPENVEKIRVEIAGGNVNGRLTPVRAENIREEIAKVLGRQVDVETNISAEKGAYLHKLDTNVYVTLRDDAATQAKGKEGRGGKSVLDEIKASLEGHTIAAGLGADGIEVQVRKEGSPWDLRVGVGSGVAVAATKSIGKEDLGIERKGEALSLDYRAGPFIETQSWRGGPRVGGEVLVESQIGKVKPYVGIKVGLDSEGISPSAAIGVTCDIWGAPKKDEKK